MCLTFVQKKCYEDVSTAVYTTSYLDDGLEVLCNYIHLRESRKENYIVCVKKIDAEENYFFILSVVESLNKNMYP